MIYSNIVKILHENREKSSKEYITSLHVGLGIDMNLIIKKAENTKEQNKVTQKMEGILFTRI